MFLEAVVSKVGIVLFGLKSSQFFKEMLEPNKKLLISRKTLDMFNSLVALRSYVGYSENDMAYLLDQFGMWYVKIDKNNNKISPEYVEERIGIHGATVDYDMSNILQNRVYRQEKKQKLIYRYDQIKLK